MNDIDWGYVRSSEPQTRRHALTFIVSSMYHSTSERRNRKIKSSICMYTWYTIRFVVRTHLWCVVVIFSVSLQRKNTRASSVYHCFSVLRIHKCGIICTCFHTFMFISVAGIDMLECNLGTPP